VEMEKRHDERGNFARTWCRREFSEHGLDSRLEQCNTSFNERKGTLRGMHFQLAPHEEPKLVRPTAGGIYDVIVDLRPNSASYCHWLAVELQAGDGRMLFVPAGFAHGFETLVDRTEVLYQMGEEYHPESASGVRWNDPVFGIQWPAGGKLISARDQTYPDYLPLHGKQRTGETGAGAPDGDDLA